MDDASWQQSLSGLPSLLPGVAADPEGFRRHAEDCRARGGARPEHLADLYLAFAVAGGDAAALRRFEQLVRPDLAQAARRLARGAELAAEVAQAAMVRLLVPGAGGRPRLLEYLGRGPLRGWVGVAALRVALDLQRRQAPPVDGEALLEELVGAEPDPELRHLRSLYRAVFREELQAALAALEPRARALLRLTYVEGVTLAHLGRLYGVHESTASRWLDQARSRVAADARRRLVARLAVSPATAESVARMAVSQLDLSIARLLATR